MIATHSRRHSYRRLRITITAILIFFLALHPVSAYALDDPTTTPAVEQSTEPTASEETQIVPEDDDPYIYNPTTGMWENSTYAWDPNTGQTKPKTELDYSYNPETEQWDTTDWIYDPETESYKENQEPNISSNPIAPSVADPAPADDAQSNSFFDLYYDASISNSIRSSSTSGDATVEGNTTAGDATSGDAVTIATIINLLQSSWSELSNVTFTTFISNVFNNLFGDIYIDPGALPSDTTPLENVAINASGSGSITNDINLSATSGDATVANNTSAGNATSGDVSVLANIINSISSSITSGTSFIGILNIFGNLEGDVLLPAFFTNLLQSTQSTQSSTDSQISTSTNQSIDNTVTSDAATGDAIVMHNTAAGSATSGDAVSNIAILNLTGRSIIGTNALFVFVNVFGTWIGAIVDAPGARSAVLGDQGTTSSQLPASITTSETQTISNDVTLTAKSGDATVDSNTNAGNATTGDATTGANIVNIENSSLSLAGWFGILFINIFGNWVGSFGVDTTAGELPTVTTPSPTAGSMPSAQQATQPLTATFVAFFNPNSDSTATDDTDDSSAVLASATTPTSSDANSIAITTQPDTAKAKENNYWFAALSTFMGISILASERLITLRKRNIEETI